MNLEERQIVNQAIQILDSHLKTHGPQLNKPEQVISYLRLKLAELEHEVFAVIFLNNRNLVIEYRELFRGTIDGASVHPREVIKKALELNAAALVFAHNHPSGVAEPSTSDERITRKLQQACAIVDIRVLDHFIIAGKQYVSFAERGLL